MSLETINSNVRSINSFISDIVQESGSRVSLLDLYSRAWAPKFRWEMLEKDQLHLNDRGYQRVNDLLADHIRGAATSGR